MKYASFFSGIGGFELALDAAGHQRVFSCEIDEFCNKVMKERYGNEHTAKDIRKVQASRIPKADLWVGGFPCQDLSVAGKRGGITASRSGLVWRLLELAKIRAPRLIVLENVPGLLNSKQGRDLALLVREMAKLGYVGCYRVLDAQFTGVPQRRRRVFLVGYLGAECPLEVLFEPKSVGRDLAAGKEKGKIASGKVARSLGGVGGGQGYGANKGTLVAAAITRSAGHKAHSSPRGDGSDDLVVEPVAFDDHNKPKTKTGTLVSGKNSGGRNDLNSPLVFEDRKILKSPISAHYAKQGASGGGHGEEDNLIIEDRKILNQAMTSKWSKGSSGPAGDEHHNLIVSSSSGLPTNSRIHDVGGKAPTLQAAKTERRGGTTGPLIAAPLTAGSHPKSNAHGRRSEDDVNLVSGTLQASGAGTSRPAGMASEPDFLIVSEDGSNVSVRREASTLRGSQAISRQTICGNPHKEERNIVAFQPTGGSRDVSAGKKSPPLKVGSGLSIPSSPAVAFQQSQSGVREADTHATLDAMNGSRRCNGVRADMQVRRLTPTECERLQGFPDGWTCLCGVRPDCPERRIPPWVDPDGFTLGGCGHSACGCTCSDSSRYKALGNAVAVPAVRWIADRLPV